MGTTDRPRVPLRTALATAVALVGSACVGTTPPGQGPGDPTEITFMIFGDPEETLAYRRLVEAYEARDTGVAVGLIEASDREDLLARLGTSFAGGVPPDLFLINYRFYGQFASRGVLEPVEDRLRTSRVIDEEDFYPEALDAFRWEDRLTCLAQNVSSLVVYYNRDLFREIAVPEPEPGWTWEEMVERAALLTGPPLPVMERHGLGLEPSLIQLAPFVWSNGGEIVDDPERPTRLALDTPEALEALYEFLNLRRDHRVVPRELELKSEPLEARFLNGRLGMYLSSRRSTPVLRTITDFDWDVAPLPVLGEPAGILHSDAYCIARASERKEAAWEFIEFALGPEGQRIVARSGRTVPSHIEVSRSEAFLDPEAKPANSRVFLDTIPHIRRIPSISTWPEIEDAADIMLESAFFQRQPVSAVAAHLIGETEPIFARAR